MKDRLQSIKDFRKDLVLTIDDLRYDARDKEVRELSLLDFKTDPKDIHMAESVSFVINFKSRT